MSRVLTASITELCAADHKDDPSAMAAWTANKSISGVEAMLDRPEQRFFVCELDGALIGVGAISIAGMITLNYVDPGARFRGASKAMLARLETELAGLGHAEGKLVATATALRFYEGAGWVTDGPQATGRRINGYPMRKRL